MILTLTSLEFLGLTKEQINQANDFVCGTMTVEGAPFLKEEHLPVFDCASKCGKSGTRYISLGRTHPHDGGGTAEYFRGDFKNN